MNTSKKIFFLIFIVILAYHMQAVISGNWSCEPLSPNGCENSSGGGDYLKQFNGLSQITLGELVKNGAILYFQSFSDYQRFLKIIESSDNMELNFDDAIAVIESVIKNLTSANENYYTLYVNSLLYTYKDEFIRLLRDFDYNSFQKRMGLIPSIFKRVRQRLRRCDIYSIYKNIYEDNCTLLDSLFLLRFSISNKNMPSIKNIWNCNQQFAEGELFGQYVAMVFFEVLKKDEQNFSF